MRRPGVLVPAAALLAAVAGSVYGGLRMEGAWYTDFDPAAIALSASLGALAVFAWTARRVAPAASWRERARRWWMAHRWEAAGFLAVLALALFMRSFRLGDFPPPDGLWLVEENNNGGNAYAALHSGERRIDYAATHLLSTFGLAFFGEGASALRLPFLLFSMVSFVPFYLALRELVSARAALGALALFAVARWAIFSARVADDPWLAPSLELWVIYFMVRAGKYGTPGGFLGLGITSALVSYEYFGYRHLPMMAVGLVALVWGWRLAVRVYRERPPAVEAARLALASSWRQALVFIISFYIVIAPMALSPRGADFYLEPYRRQSSDREAAGVSGLLPENWQDRLTWGVEIFAPFAPQELPDAYDQNVPGLRYFDPASSFLFALAFLYVLLRPRDVYRAFFIAYFAGTLAVGSVFPLNFVIYRFTTLIPIVFILIAFLLDDAWLWWDRLVHGTERWLLAGLVLVLIAYAGIWNGRVFYGEFVPNERVQAAYYDRHFAFCNRARDLGPDAAVQAYSQDNPLDFIFVPRSDYAWVCADVAGRAAASPDALVPIELPAGESSGASVYLAPTYGPSTLTAFIQAAYPSVAGPSAVLRTPTGEVASIWYAVPASDVAARRGLVRVSGAGSEAVDGFPVVTWNEGGALRWTGLVRASGGQQLEIESSAPVVVQIDGRVVASNVAAFDAAAVVDAGWHWIAIEAQAEAGAGSLTLGWRAPDGSLVMPVPEDFLALAEPVGLAHQVRLQDELGDFTVWSLAPYPSFTAVPVLTQAAKRDPAGPNPTLLEQSWTGTWDVASSESYALQLHARGGTARLFLDGEFVVEVVSPGDGLVWQDVEVELEAGAHRVEVVHEHQGGSMAGAVLYVNPAPGATRMPPGPLRAY
jgi:hypothetical protein